jgi:hypothetical protein
MPRLEVNPGSPASWEIELKPGSNRLGRGVSNDFTINDPSVSGSHCEILVQDGGATVKDLGSTNGTYINRVPVQEARLEAGHALHLGGVEMVFHEAAPAAPASVPAAAPRLRTAYSVAREAAAPIAVEPPIAPPVTVAAAASAPASSGNCKYHPKSAGRYLCNQCHHFFCELCVTSRNVGGVSKKLCRHCGVEVAPVQVQLQRPRSEAGFFTRLPGAFIYPFKGSGSLVLIMATLVFAGLDVISGGISIFAKVIALGYLFSYMQSIIHCTSVGDDEIANLPGMDGLFGAFFTLVGTVAFCFGVPIGLAVAKFFFDVDMIPWSAVLVTALLSCLYFPMAFLAVALKDSVMAANPLLVVPSICKVPLEYLVTAILITGVFGIRILGSLVTSAAKATGFATHDMSVLLVTFGLRLFWAFASVYLLTVGMRILGLLYVTKQHKLGWYNR